MSRRGELNEKELNIIKKKVNDEEAFEKFFRDCYLRNLRPATVEYYKNEFQAFRRRIDKELVECNHKDIEDFILMSKQPIKITTINTRLRALRSFYNFLFKNKLIDKNPMKNIKLLRDRQKNIETLDNKEIELLSVKNGEIAWTSAVRKGYTKLLKAPVPQLFPQLLPLGPSLPQKTMEQALKDAKLSFVKFMKNSKDVKEVDGVEKAKKVSHTDQLSKTKDAKAVHKVNTSNITIKDGKLKNPDNVETVKSIDVFDEVEGKINGKYHLYDNGQIIFEHPAKNGNVIYKEVRKVPNDRVGEAKELDSMFSGTKLEILY